VKLSFHPVSVTPHQPPLTQGATQSADESNDRQGQPQPADHVYQHKSHSSRGANLGNLTSVPISTSQASASNSVSKILKCALLNARSVRQKSNSIDKAADICDLISGENIDILCITESWIRDNALDSQVLSELTPPGYLIVSVPRVNKRGGGVAVMYRSSIKLSMQTSTPRTSFEHLKASIKHAGTSLSLCVMYRPPTSGLYNTFLEEFAEFIGEIQTSPGVPLVVGDFNVHVDVPTDSNTSKFLTLLESANLCQHVTIPTHHRGHTLDLVITKGSYLNVKDRYVSSLRPLDCYVSPKCA
jgi:exonuclease III